MERGRGGEGSRERKIMGKGEEDGDSQKEREGGRGNAVVARKPTSNMSAKGGEVSLYERRGKEGNSTYMSALTTIGGSATDST